MRKSLKLSLNFAGMAVLAGALIAANIILFRYDSQISSLLSPPIVNEEAYELTSAEGQELSKQIIEEGSVLLRNENETLPLNKEEDTKVNVFGWHSVDWIYGSVGRNASGGVRPEENDFSTNVDIYDALIDYGIEYNEELYDMYFDYYTPFRENAVASSSHISTFMNLTEPPMSYYSDSILNNALDYSDTALVVISRMTGESGNPLTYKDYQPKVGSGVYSDYTKHYLELSTEEIDLLTYVGANFENTIVIINSANVMELGQLETIEGIDAALMVGFTGTRAASAIPGLLYGDTSPSGRATDTYAYDLYTNPANYFVSSTYSDYSRTYIDYLEGVYVGYRWYETADAEGYWDDISNEYGTGYDGVVQYPFGFGLSYTTFDYEVTNISIDENSSFTDEEEITFTVNITNTGEYTGREVVEIYVETPYTDGEIEKPAVQLAGFDKTIELDPNQMETLTISIDPYDFASYDCYDENNNGFKGYELEEGEYKLSFRTDSHTVRNVTYDGEEREGTFTFNVDSTITIETDPTTGNEVGNLFTGEDTIDLTPIDGTEKDGSFDPNIPWFTREDFYSLDEWESLNVSRAATPSAQVTGTTIYPDSRSTEWDNATVDAFGDAVDTSYPSWGDDYGILLAENGIVTEDGEQLGADYDDPLWEDVLDQLTMSEVLGQINNYYSVNPAIDSVGKPILYDYDGPSQIKGFTDAPRGTGYPAISVLGSTWNKRLAYDFGKSFGNEMKSVGVNGLWGWAIDSHRSAWFGRNNESPSEDPLLAGQTIANAVDGLNKTGRYSILKHFTLYGAEGDSIWLTEQALREVYLKPFREAIVEAEALGVMTTYQGIGAEHSETTEGLLTGVLRREWDFKGIAVTDYIYTDEYLDAFVRAGGDLGMNVSVGTSGLVYSQTGSTARLQNRIREIAKHLLYTWLRADYNEKQYLLNPDDGDTYVSSVSIPSWSWWQPLLYTLDAIIVTEVFLWAALLVLNTFWKIKETELVSQTTAESSTNTQINEVPQTQIETAIESTTEPVNVTLAETIIALGTEPVDETKDENVETQKVSEKTTNKTPTETKKSTASKKRKTGSKEE